MPKWFNVAGPCKPDIHYMLSPLARIPQLDRLIAQQGYFVVHAPRQTGKTTAMLALAQQLTASGQYVALMVSAEVGAVFSQDLGAAELALLGSWRDRAENHLPNELYPPDWPEAASGQRIQAALRAWSRASTRPLVIFIDEIDSLQNETLISILRQLRSGYPDRPQNFPHSLALIGVRDVRDYKVSSGGSDRLNTASPFNIKIKSLTLRNFNVEEVGQLYAQHTAETGQVFALDAVNHAFELTQGQPWLVNALAKETVEELVTDTTQSINVEHIEVAKEALIRRQDTHLDSLVSILREDRVRSVIGPMLAGQELGVISQDDRQFLVDLGLVVRNPAGGLMPANPIYREVLPRVLASGPQDSLPVIHPSWLTADGTLDADRLLQSFLGFWRQHGQPLLKSAPYHEIAPHLVLMAFLHRVVNGGGTLEREYAIGTDRMDLCLRYGDVAIAMELKVWREGRPDPLKAGLAQLDRYLAGLGLTTGWLVIFDQRPGIPAIAERTKTEQATTRCNRPITVIRG
ncbi:ATP-binding protein [Leptolyngbya cf. ectocarpi LEGE 11479]|uniref:ATP-binding protein n=1 Tax=Leptolyngbya cf. ectocarpi LEGE 11479 TaxID=1828722 RepID=A0A928WY71_LEPEC|nr:ATP-binding protein [Leptolyngbya ectocarpi]MBE9065589.1 ATP-binding protein [Leptolyngbya cf. ectocarpi LEGE 11479]